MEKYEMALLHNYLSYFGYKVFSNNEKSLDSETMSFE